MPPGMWHMVYTPVGGMTSGGHFLSYDTMHLTYLARAFDDSPKSGVQKGSSMLRRDYSTNECQSVDRQILRMILALPTAVYDRKHNYHRLLLIGQSHKFIIRTYSQATTALDDAYGKEHEKRWYNSR
jgi:hypothetical protein